MADRKDIETSLQTLLQPHLFKDYGPNGLQVEGKPQVQRLASGVTASLACMCLPGDGRPLRRIAWCTGGAQSFFEDAIAAGADVFMTGEVSEPQAHPARETGVAFLACGHHATERYGAPAVGHWLAGQWGLAHSFIDVDNPA